MCANGGVQGNFKKAESFYLTALKTRRRLHGEQSAEVATALRHFGDLRHQQVALHVAQHATVSPCHSAQRHFRWLRFVCCDGCGRVHQGNVEDAKALFRQALAIQPQSEDGASVQVDQADENGASCQQGDQ